jgi:hypothetical protein
MYKRCIRLNSDNDARYQGPYLLRNVIYCGRCGCRLSPQTSTHKHYDNGRHYVVRTYRCLARMLKDGPACTASHGSQWVEAMAWEALESHIRTPGLIERLVGEELGRLESDNGSRRMEADLGRAEERRRKVERTAKKLVEAQMETDSPLLTATLRDKLSELDREASELDRQIADIRLRIEAACSYRQSIEATLAILDEIRTRIREGIDDDEEKREIIDILEPRVFAWKDGRERRVRVELPLGSHHVNREACSPASSCPTSGGRRPSPERTRSHAERL